MSEIWPLGLAQLWLKIGFVISCGIAYWLLRRETRIYREFNRTERL